MVDRSALLSFKPTTRRPADFDAFWDAARDELARVPLSLEMERSSLRSTPEVDVHEVHFASLGGARLFAWLARAVEGPAKRPGLIVYPGYSGTPGIPRAWAKAGYIALQLSPRGHHLSNGEVDPGFPGLMTSGVDEPGTYVYRGMYCDVWRAVDVLLQQEGVDETRIGVTGGSQGGALSLIAAAGRREIVACAADVPFLTGIRDSLRLGGSYPYEEIKDYLRLQPERQERVLNTLDYVDTLNFADRIGAATLVSVGLRDDVCPPHTAFALIERLRGQKELKEYPDGAHEGGGFLHGQYKERWLAERLLAPIDRS
jgi:cephalosporin-C deacetylase